MSVKFTKAIAVLLVAFTLPAKALLPPLEREISLQTQNEKIVSVFEKIREQAQVNFSYPAALVADIQPVSVSIKNKTVREALSIILPASILVKQKNNYIILKSKPVEKVAEKKQISGYVVDQSTQQKVPNVTVYDKASLQSVTTDKYGYYEITVPATTQSITVNKLDFKDTVAEITTVPESAMINFTIQPMRYFDRLKDSLHLKEKLNALSTSANHLMSNFSGYINSLNVRDTLERDLQISFLPFIGTNHYMSGSVYNHVSLNVLGGFARGCNGIELAGVFNIDKENVNGFQGAGVFNIVGGSLKGMQAAGCFNITGKNSMGVQASGLLNINAANFYGAGFAGYLNISKRHIGIGAAGLMNIAGNLNGIFMAGVANVSDSLTGVEAAGVFNVSNRSAGSVQLAGLFNVNHKGKTHTQISSLFNVADIVTGTQISMLNIADSAIGVPIGFLSFVRKGTHQLEISSDEWFTANAGFRTGVPSFYNTLSMGARASNKGTLWHFTYGIGSSVKLSSKWRMDFTATSSHVSQNTFYVGLSELYRFYIGAEYKPAKKFAIAFGPHFNYYITDALSSQYESTYRTITPTSLYTHVGSLGVANTLWLGARLGLRFF